jgi:hypothetical protein
MVSATGLREIVNGRVEWFATPARVALLTGLALLPMVWGCTPLSPAGPAALTASVREDIYKRAMVEFAEARLVKPAADSSSNSVMTRFTPLLIRETGATAMSSGRGERDIESSPDTNCAVYFGHSQVVVAGHVHDQLTYCWRAPEAGRAQPGDLAWPDQGVRITLDSSGQPVIWETEADQTGAKVIFVAQSLEAVAAAQFGKPLVGRRFAIERSLADAPDVIVARVIEDGPVPMGPMIYVRADMRGVVTLACRCMPIQVKRLAGEQRYELLEWAAGEGGGAEAEHRWATVPSRLEERLRLPGSF